MYTFRNTYCTHKPASLYRQLYCCRICHVDKLTHLNIYNRQRRGLVEEDLEQLQIRLLGSHVKTSSPTFQVLCGWKKTRQESDKLHITLISCLSTEQKSPSRYIPSPQRRHPLTAESSHIGQTSVSSAPALLPYRDKDFPDTSAP